MRFVLDCSVAISWCFKDEASPKTKDLLQQMTKGVGAVVPIIWQSEVLNVFLIAERRKRIEPQDVPEYMQLLFQRLPIERDTESSYSVLGNIVYLARLHGLTSYDATYLELAIRHNLPIATLDRNLKKAAKKAGLSILV